LFVDVHRREYGRKVLTGKGIMQPTDLAFLRWRTALLRWREQASKALDDCDCDRMMGHGWSAACTVKAAKKRERVSDLLCDDDCDDDGDGDGRLRRATGDWLLVTGCWVGGDRYLSGAA